MASSDAAWNELSAKLGDHPSIGTLTESDGRRFLTRVDNNVDKAISLLLVDQRWRSKMNLSSLNVAHVQTQLRTQKFIIPGTFDKQGRPIIIFNAALHDPSADFLDTLQLAVYGFELIMKSLPEGVDQILIIENLDGFKKSNADSRMVKYLLELMQDHYPERIGDFIAVTAPWYYRVLFKVVKPWLNDDLLSKVHIYADTKDLSKYVDMSQVPASIGGSLPFEIEGWLAERASIEGVDLDAPSDFDLEPEIVAIFSDFPASAFADKAIKRGWIKKQGGYVRNFNKRYCILSGDILFYYKEENGQKPEGFVELMGSTLEKQKNNVFCITTGANKSCIFSTDKTSYNDWTEQLLKVIEDLANK